MSRTKRADLDIFILALVRTGLATPYDLKVQAGLSVGSTTPVLTRLKKDGLISASKVGKRRSRRYELTDSGRRMIDSQWRRVIESPADFDSMLRIIYLSWLLGSRETLAKSITKSISALKDLAAVRDAEAAQIRSISEDAVGGKSFQWLRTFTSGAQARAQADALAQVAKMIAPTKRK